MKPSQRREIARGLSVLTSLGVTMAACLLIGLWIGRALDSVLGTSPWMLFAFLIFGALAAIKSMFSIAMKEWGGPQ